MANGDAGTWMRELSESVRRPGAAYRGKPFWAWNGKLEEEELRRQVRVLHQMGLGGFFMHARVGLETPYLSDEWFRCISACIDEAEKLGMEPWLYDEDRWPSGAAGGIVTKDERYRMRVLEYRTVAPADAGALSQKAMLFAIQRKGGELHAYRRIAREAASSLRPGEELLSFEVRLEEPSNWYNGATYLDTMNPDAVARFIEVTHAEYARRLGDKLGKVVPGIFTDEPNYRTWNKNHLAWTDRLPEVFQARYGYDLGEHLPELVYDPRAPSRARYHYYDCVTHLFVTSFAKQIGDWCGHNRQLFTGHVLCEETLSSQTGYVGAAMRFYEHMQAPGMDLLTEHNREYDTAKQVSSVAHQMGRTWRLTETYGCTGWDFPFEGHKALGDWQAALGINLRCQHLSFYTMEGEAKRDYPASIFYQSPFFEHYGKVEDYFARITALMTRGEEVRDLGVIHPIESAWMIFSLQGDKNPRLAEIEESQVAVRDTVLSHNIDFDYLDEEMLGRLGKIDGAVLRLGRGAYKTVLVPPTLTLRSTTLDLLERFIAEGGTVVFAGDVATHVDAMPSDRAAKVAARAKRCVASGPALADAVGATSRRISVKDPNGAEIGSCLHMLREDDGALYLFLCNTGHLLEAPKGELTKDTPVCERTLAWEEVVVTAFAECKGQPVEVDLETGDVSPARARRTEGGWAIETSLGRLGSRLFVAPKKDLGTLEERPAARATAEERLLGGDTWPVVLSDPNCVVLDMPRYRLGDGAFGEPTEVLRADRAIRDALGIPRRGGDMKQPWVTGGRKGDKGGAVEMIYELDVDVVPQGELFLAIERPELYTVTFNGQRVGAGDAGYWTDRSLRKLAVDPALVRRGKNEIRLFTRYDAAHPGFEIVYLLGTFGVRLEHDAPRVVAPVSSLRLGDWTAQGLPFYSGNLTYTTKLDVEPAAGRRIFVRIARYAGVAVRVLIDGKAAGIAAWAPNEVEITGLAKQGSTIGIEILGHRRNSHGPHHHKLLHPRWTGPGEFVAEGEWWRDGYGIVETGLFERPVFVVR